MGGCGHLVSLWAVVVVGSLVRWSGGALIAVNWGGGPLFPIGGWWWSGGMLIPVDWGGGGDGTGHSH